MGLCVHGEGSGERDQLCTSLRIDPKRGRRVVALQTRFRHINAIGVSCSNVFGRKYGETCQQEDRRRWRPEEMNPCRNLSRLSRVKKVIGRVVSAVVPDVNMLKCTGAG